MPGTEGKWPAFENYADLAEDTGRFIGRKAGFTEHRVGTVSDPVMWRFVDFWPKTVAGQGRSRFRQLLVLRITYLDRRHDGIAALLLLLWMKLPFIRLSAKHAQRGGFLLPSILHDLQ